MVKKEKIQEVEVATRQKLVNAALKQNVNTRIIYLLPKEQGLKWFPAIEGDDDKLREQLANRNNRSVVFDLQVLNKPGKPGTRIGVACYRPGNGQITFRG
jgi:hypothetical protein